MQTPIPRHAAPGLALFLLAGCATAPRSPSDPASVASDLAGSPASASGAIAARPARAAQKRYTAPWSSYSPWIPGQPLLQGMAGSSFFDQVSVDGGGVATKTDGDEGDLDQLPFLGGGGQWKFGGESLDLGLEAMVSIAARANAAAFASGGGGTTVAVDVDLTLVDLYGGPFASVFLSDQLRAYVAVGPMVQFAEWEQTDDTTHDDGLGFGVGTYARGGLEFVLPSQTMIGIGGRWSDSTVDLDGGLGDLEIEGLQAFVTISRWY